MASTTIPSRRNHEFTLYNLALILGLDKSEVDRVRKIKQRLPDHKLIGIARWSIAPIESSQSALCYLFVCEDNVAYLSAPEMVFTNDTISIDSTTRRSVYKTTYNLTSPNTKYAYPKVNRLLTMLLYWLRMKPYARK